MISMNTFKVTMVFSAFALAVQGCTDSDTALYNSATQESLATTTTTPAIASESPDSHQISVAITQVVDNYNSGNYAGLVSLSCGALQKDLLLTTSEAFTNEANEDKTKRGLGSVIEVTNVRINGAEATAEAVIHYEKRVPGADPANNLLMSMVLQKTDTSWKLCEINSTPH